MGMIEDLALWLAMAVAVLCGAAAGRVFALEGENRRTSILAAGYCGAGAGLLSASLLAFGVVLIGTMLGQGTGFIADPRGAGETIGSALMWGTASGAGGGLAVGVVVALFKRYDPPQVIYTMPE